VAPSREQERDFFASLRLPLMNFQCLLLWSEDRKLAENVAQEVFALLMPL
jgi:hypothetical protein